MKKNILIITSEFPPLPGGIGNHAYNLAEQLQHQGYQVVVIADQRDSNSDNEAIFDASLGVKVYRVHLKKPRWLMYIKRIQLALKLLQQQDVAIMSGKFPLWLGGVLSRFYACKWVAIIHGSEVNYTQPLLRNAVNWSLKQFDDIIAVSHYTKGLVSDLNVKRITVIPNGFNPSRWLGIDTEQKFLKGSPCLLTVGNVTERKGQLQVVRQLPAVLKRYPEAHYHCVGFPTEKARVLEEAKRLGIEDQLTFHGHVSHEVLSQFYRAADVFVMISTETQSGDVEGFGIAILEANYFGLPAIGTNRFGITDAIVDGQTGKLIDPTRDHAMALAIADILEHIHQYQSGAGEWAEKHNWDQIIKQYITIIA